MVYDVIYSDLKHLPEHEHYIHEEPKFNLNEFLDNLRSPNSNK